MDRFVDHGSLTIERRGALFVDEDSEPVEQSCDKVTPHVFPGALVDGSDAFEQVKLSSGSLGASSQPFDSVGELLIDDALLHRDVVQLLPKLGRGDTALGGEFDQTLLLALELEQLRAQRRLHLPILRLHLISGVLKLRAHYRDLIDRQSFALDLLSDRLVNGF